jgi:hypothetical protein
MFAKVIAKAALSIVDGLHGVSFQIGEMRLYAPCQCASLPKLTEHKTLSSEVINLRLFHEVGSVHQCSTWNIGR